MTTPMNQRALDQSTDTPGRVSFPKDCTHELRAGSALRAREPGMKLRQSRSGSGRQTAALRTQSAADPSGSNSARKTRVSAEAARYGVLRRLMPALKHDMVVNLQAVSMMAEVLNARLERGSLAPSALQPHIGKLNRIAREAVMNCLTVAAWIQPVEDEGIRLPQGVDECLALLASNFNFRGVTVTKDVAETEFQVSRAALRHLLCGSLITLTDAIAGPCELHVQAEVVSGLAEISVRVTPKRHSKGVPFEPGYRQLEWADVQALAAEEGIELVRTSEQIRVRMPRAFASSPLQIAPL